MEPSSRTFKAVYTIVERKRDKKRFWLRVGAAFENRDGSTNVLLDAMPTNGELQIREYRPFGHRAPEDEPVEDVPATLAG